MEARQRNVSLGGRQFSSSETLATRWCVRLSRVGCRELIILFGGRLSRGSSLSLSLSQGNDQRSGFCGCVMACRKVGPERRSAPGTDFRYGHARVFRRYIRARTLARACWKTPFGSHLALDEATHVDGAHLALAARVVERAAEAVGVHIFAWR